MGKGTADESKQARQLGIITSYTIIYLSRFINGYEETNFLPKISYGVIQGKKWTILVSVSRDINVFTIPLKKEGLDELTDILYELYSSPKTAREPWNK